MSENTASGSPSSAPMTVAKAERAKLADLLAVSGPDAPTLCEGWTTRDLAAHLVVREYRPDAAAGMFVPFLSGHLDSVQNTYGSKPYAELVEMFRCGPPAWNPMRAGDNLVNAVENFVHHEDVRRAASTGEPGQAGDVEPRQLSEAHSNELWAAARRMVPLVCAGSPARVILQRTDVPGGEHSSLEGGSAGGPRAQVSGPAGELVLWLLGRDDVAQVKIEDLTKGAQEKIKRRTI
ncbi:TIGR03085 family metal-binding protein [Corynebacterium heidelbergense]|nr:TIGR03085 family metal-binding protein [Corynebacterium heidelbergense]WCZ36706.1 hypothetical protein CHEID_05845 [Corynebacterium heidelbergense]